MLNLTNFQKNLIQLLPNPHQKSYLLAVSGGVDSMVLADLFRISGFDFHVAHINYHLRNEDSNLDEKLVSDFCKKHKIPFHLYEVTEQKPENSIQTWARELRYHFFRKIQKKKKLDFLVTAHHLDDQLETFIINLSKAAGIRGLSGIPANENQILRPILDFSKSEIYAFAKENNINFREDSSNKKTDYLRNRIRCNIVPELLKTNAHFLRNFSKSINLINQTKEFLNKTVDEKIRNFRIDFPTKTRIINRQKFLEEPELIRYEILKYFDFSDEKEMQKILKSRTGSVFFSPDFHLIVNRNELILKPISTVFEPKTEELELKINKNKNINIPPKIKKEIRNFGSCQWKIDEKKVRFPLKLRRKKEGDFFFPVGMTGKKKVSKFFKDEKLSIPEKQNIWLLCDADDHILGILPFRQDRRFETKNKEAILMKITESQDSCE